MGRENGASSLLASVGLLVSVLKVPGCPGDSEAGAVLGASEAGRGAGAGAAPTSAAALPLALTRCVVAGGRRTDLL